MASTPRPVLIMNGVLAGLGVVLGGSALGDFLPVTTVGLLMLIYSGVTLAWGVITQGLVTPNANVAALLVRPKKLGGGITSGAKVVAGPAIAERTVLNEGEPVDVTAKAP